MATQEICEKYNIEEPIIFFEPSDVFNKGILGVTEDHKHVVYGYYTLAAVLAEDYEKEWNKKEHGGSEEKPDFYFEAMEWIDYNTIGSLPGCNPETCPIIIYELTE